MKTVRTHSTQSKKSYSQPLLNRLGSVNKLTKGKLGSLFDGGTAAFDFDGKDDQ